MASVKSADYAAKKYLAGVRAVGGAQAYYACGAKAATGGVKAVAACMKGLKKKVSEVKWAQKYKLAYEGESGEVELEEVEVE